MAKRRNRMIIKTRSCRQKIIRQCFLDIAKAIAYKFAAAEKACIKPVHVQATQNSIMEMGNGQVPSLAKQLLAFGRC